MLNHIYSFGNTYRVSFTNIYRPDDEHAFTWDGVRFVRMGNTDQFDMFTFWDPDPVSQMAMETFFRVLTGVLPGADIIKFVCKPEDGIFRPTFSFEGEHPGVAPGHYEITFSYEQMIFFSHHLADHPDSVESLFEKSIRDITGAKDDS